MHGDGIVCQCACVCVWIETKYPFYNYFIVRLKMIVVIDVCASLHASSVQVRNMQTKHRITF